jgi:hypothetical protein
MPFVYTCPPDRTVLNMTDRIYVFGAPKDIKVVQKVLALPFERKGNLLQLGAASRHRFLCLSVISLLSSPLYISFMSCLFMIFFILEQVSTKQWWRRVDEVWLLVRRIPILLLVTMEGVQWREH